MKIYTKTGDKGSTSLLGGKRVTKSHPRLDAYGTVDELNSSVGLARAQLVVLRKQENLESYCESMDQWLQQIQNDLFVLGSQLACESNKLKAQLPTLKAERLTEMENLIDQCQGQLPELKEFILPAGTRTAAQLHLSRAICRRAERVLFPLLKKENLDPFALVYLNRLSDLLFVLARWANKFEGAPETVWQK